MDVDVRTHWTARPLPTIPRMGPRRPDTSVAFERGLVRFLLGALCLLAMCVAVALLLQGCSSAPLPRTPAERESYCASIERTRGDVAKAFAGDATAQAAFNAQLDERSEAASCPR